MKLKIILKKIINIKKLRKKKRIVNDIDNKIEGDYNKINIDKKNKKAKEYYNFCYSNNKILL